MNKKTSLIFVLFVFILVGVPLLRFFSGKPLLTGDIPYYHLRLAQDFWNEGILFYESTIWGGRLTVLTPYHVLLAFFIQLFSHEYVILVITFVFRILTFLLLAGILRRILPGLQNYYLFLYSISIPVIAAMASPSPLAFSLLLYVASIFLYLHNKRRSAAVLFFLFSMHGIFENFLGVATLYFLSRIKKQGPHFIFFFLLFFLCAFQIPFSFFTTTVVAYSASSIAEFGGFMSESIFFLLLSFVGVLFIWSSKKQHYALYIFLFVLLILSLNTPVLLPYANFFIVYLAAHTLVTFVQVRFRLKNIRPFFFLFLVTSLLIGPILFMYQLTLLPPDRSLMEVLEAPILPVRSTIFSSSNKGFFISYAGHIAILDKNPVRSLNTFRIRALYDAAVNAHELTMLKRTLTSFNATHVLLTPELRHRSQRFEQLLSNNETFKRVYATDTYVLYEYVP